MAHDSSTVQVARGERIELATCLRQSPFQSVGSLHQARFSTVIDANGQLGSVDHHLIVQAKYGKTLMATLCSGVLFVRGIYYM